MFAVLLGGAALAGWMPLPQAQAEGCTLYQAALEDGVMPVRAECQWEGVSAKVLLSILSDQTRWQDAATQLRQSIDLGPGEAGQRIYRSYGVSGMPEREVVIAQQRQDTEDGAVLTWSKDADQSDITRASAEVAMDSGRWEITAAGAGVHVVLELRYDPGGRLPSGLHRRTWPVRVAQTLTDLKAAGEAR